MRLLPHVSNFSPVAATALFAGMTLSRRWLAIAVPLAAMLLSDVFLGRLRLADDGRGLRSPRAARGHRHAGARPARLAAWRSAGRLPHRCIFYAMTNFAVWALTGLYSTDAQGTAGMLRRGAAVPETYGRGRPVLERGAVRRRFLLRRRQDRQPRPRPSGLQLAYAAAIKAAARVVPHDSGATRARTRGVTALRAFVADPTNRASTRESPRTSHAAAAPAGAGPSDAPAARLSRSWCAAPAPGPPVAGRP